MHPAHTSALAALHIRLRRAGLSDAYTDGEVRAELVDALLPLVPVELVAAASQTTLDTLVQRGLPARREPEVPAWHCNVCDSDVPGARSRCWRCGSKKP